MKPADVLVLLSEMLIPASQKDREQLDEIDKWLGKDSDLKATRKFEFGKPQETWFTN